MEMGVRRQLPLEATVEITAACRKYCLRS